MLYLAAHMGTAFFTEGGNNFFCVYMGKKCLQGDVLAAIAWVKGGGLDNFFHLQRKKSRIYFEDFFLAFSLIFNF